MVAVPQEFEIPAERPLRFFPLRHTYRFCALRCPKSNGHGHLRRRIYDGCDQLESCSRDPIGYLGSRWNIYAAFFALLGLDPTGTHIFLDPKTLPEGQPWTDATIPSGDVANTSMNFDLDCPCVACSKCPKGKSAYVGNCTISLSFNTTIDVQLARKQPPPNPIPPNWSEPEWTYGHEQRHIQNLIAEANSIMKELDAYAAKSTCKPVADCDTERKLLMVKYYKRMLAFKKDESAHKHAPFNKPTGPTDGLPPIGPVPSPTK